MRVARGIIRLGSRDSSPYMAVDSKPTQDQKAKKSPSPAAGPVKALSGLSGESGIPSGPPPANRTANAITARTEISVIRSTASTFAVKLMSK